jgi:uncharacterized membrane protein
MREQETLKTFLVLLMLKRSLTVNKIQIDTFRHYDLHVHMLCSVIIYAYSSYCIYLLFTCNVHVGLSPCEVPKVHVHVLH